MLEVHQVATRMIEGWTGVAKRLGVKIMEMDDLREELRPSALITAAEEQEAFIAVLADRRERLLERLGGQPLQGR